VGEPIRTAVEKDWHSVYSMEKTYGLNWPGRQVATVHSSLPPRQWNFFYKYLSTWIPILEEHCSAKDQLEILERYSHTGKDMDLNQHCWKRVHIFLLLYQ
jgi:hypothetical protein